MESFIWIDLVSVELDGYDRIEVGHGSDIQNGEAVMVIFGYLNSFPNAITINFTNAWVTFQSDEDGRAAGFSMEIEISETYGMCMQ